MWEEGDEGHDLCMIEYRLAAVHVWLLQYGLLKTTVSRHGVWSLFTLTNMCF